MIIWRGMPAADHERVIRTSPLRMPDDPTIRLSRLEIGSGDEWRHGANALGRVRLFIHAHDPSPLRMTAGGIAGQASGARVPKTTLVPLSLSLRCFEV